MSLSTSIYYDTAANFTYDSDQVEFTAGAVTLKNRWATDMIFGASYTTTINGTYAAGSATGTATGGATITNNKLDLTGGTNKYVTYAAADNFSNTQTGAVRFKVTPAYSGSAANSVFWTVYVSAVDPTNQMRLSHGGGSLSFTCWDSSGNLISNMDFGAWSPVSGTTYEFEINFNFTAGAHRLFINGIQQGSTNTSTGTRSASVVGMRVGANGEGDGGPQFYLEDLIIYSGVQHTAAYTPGYQMYDTKYDVDNPTVTVNSGIDANALSGFEATTIVDGSDLVKYVLVVDGTPKYWDGAAWSTSDNTYTQSNTVSDINTNAAELDIDTGSSVKVRAFLHADPGTTTIPRLESVSVTYDFYIVAPTAITECILYGYIYDSQGEPLEGATVKASVTTPFFHGQRLIAGYISSTTTDSNGLWTLSLIETTTVSKSIVIDIEYSDGASGKKRNSYTVVVPNASTATFSSLATV